MNIFVLDTNLKLCAKYHNDKHCVKMILEYTQLLSNAHHLSGSSGCYKLTHKKHPCTLWLLESKHNYIWLKKLALELCLEYTNRYNKIHKCEQYIRIMTIPDLPDIPMTKFKQAMPEDVKHKNAVIAYRNYYKKHKRHLAKWKHNKIPEWYIK